MQSTTIFAICAVFVLFSLSDAKIYKDYTSINSRVPGDELIWHSSQAQQNLNFFAKVSVDVRYPADPKQTSKYTLTHLLCTGTDDTGYLDSRFDAGGPGSDTMRYKMIFNSIQNGNFEIFLYGKKK